MARAINLPDWSRSNEKSSHEPSDLGLNSMDVNACSEQEEGLK